MQLHYIVSAFPMNVKRLMNSMSIQRYSTLMLTRVYLQYHEYFVRLKFTCEVTVISLLKPVRFFCVVRIILN